MSNFKINRKSGKGEILLANKKLKTPLFMPDATRGVLKTLSSEDLTNTGTEAIVVNTYHLMLQPGMEIIKKAKGIANFMNYPGAIFSDSGGFQVFSLITQNSKLGKITQTGAEFKSPLDGKQHILTPEKSIQIQFDLGSNFMVVLDTPPKNESSKKELEIAVEITIAWAKRSKAEYLKQLKKRKINEKNRPLLLGVIQGGLDKKLRKSCLDSLEKIGFDGYGFGGWPVKNGVFQKEIVKYVASIIPKDKIRWGLGIGKPEDIQYAIKVGWDIFDCVIPSREARHGRLYLPKGTGFETINILNQQFKKDFSTINRASNIKELQLYSKAYLHHLFKLNEALGQRLASLNNLEFYNKIK